MGIQDVWVNVMEQIMKEKEILYVKKMVVKTDIIIFMVFVIVVIFLMKIVLDVVTKIKKILNVKLKNMYCQKKEFVNFVKQTIVLNVVQILKQMKIYVINVIIIIIQTLEMGNVTLIIGMFFVLENLIIYDVILP